MNKTFNSPVFGKTRHATDLERAEIVKAVSETPTAVFQELGKALKQRGLYLVIATEEDLQ